METKRRSARIKQKLTRDDELPTEKPKASKSRAPQQGKKSARRNRKASTAEPLEVNNTIGDDCSPPKRPRKVELDTPDTKLVLKPHEGMEPFGNTSESEEEVLEKKRNNRKKGPINMAKINSASSKSRNLKAAETPTESGFEEERPKKIAASRPQRKSAQIAKKYADTEATEESESDLSSADSSLFEESPVKKTKKSRRVSSSNNSDVTDEDIMKESPKTRTRKSRTKSKPVLVDYRKADVLQTNADDSKTKKKLPERCFMSKRWKSWHTDAEKASGDIVEESSVRNAGDNTIVASDRVDTKEQPKWVKDCLSIASALARHRTEEITLDEAAHIMYILKMREKEQTLADIASDIQENEGDFLKKGGKVEHSSSEDEWEEMETVEDKPQDSNKKFEITIDKKKVEIDWTVKWLRLEINKCVRAKSENAHKLHLLYWIHYLHRTVKRILDEGLATSLALSQIPPGYVKLADNSKPSMDNLRKFAKWIYSAFKLDHTFTTSIEEWGCRFQETADAAASIRDKSFNSDIQRAIVYFVCFRSINLLVRLVANCQVVARKKETDEETPKKKTNEKSKKLTKKDHSASPKGSDEPSLESIRNFWIEWWSTEEKRWISIDPLTGEMDNSVEMENKMTSPVNYIFACDNNGQMRDVGARYLSLFGTPAYRRQRTDQSWINKVFSIKMIRADRDLSQLEDMCFQNDLASRPLPKTVADYKDHPLYVLEKDLLKFQAIYPPPEKQKPIGEIRGQKIYPRSTVYTLQGDLNWIKIARSVKEGEKPYKVVKGRPNMRIPVEKRGEPKDLPLYGFWQTEPYCVPVVTNGVIPRNQYGNIYVYQDSMVPKECVHLKLPGIVGLCRRLNKEHVAAVIGWDFHVSANHPVIEGAVVLEKDVEELIAEWEAAENRRKERERKRRENRILTNWRTLIRGVLRLHHMRYVFGEKSQTVEQIKEAEQDQLPDEKVEAENQAAWPVQKFTLERMEKK